MKKKLSLIILAFIALLNFQCTEKQTVQQIENGAIISGKNVSLKVQFYSPSVVRVIKWTPEGTDQKKSLSVIIPEAPKVNVTYQNSDGMVTLTSDSLRVVISPSLATVNYFDMAGNNLLAETAQEFTPVVYHSDTAMSVKQVFAVNPKSAVYGLGQHQNGFMNYRGKKVLLSQSNTEAVNPFYISTNNYGILWDNYSKTIFEDDSINMQSMWSDVADNIDYYFVYGANMDHIIAGYRFLTGQAPMYGKWAYGYWQSKEHYDTQAELMSVAEKYRKLKIPIDNIIQDWDYWYGNQNWGSMEFHPAIFPKPDEMVKKLHAMNFHMMISIWPAMGPNTTIYADMLKHGFLYSPVGWAGFKYYDAYSPDANKMYWDYLNRGLVSKGIDAWWMDSTEPDVVNALTKESSDYELKKMPDNYLGTFARYLNPYSLVMTENIYKNWRINQPDRRAYILTRSTYAGQQRNAATTWSGDIGANWTVYRNQISAGINHSMSGIPYWTFDIGAFVLGAYEGVFMQGGKDPAYQELYTRMFQLGAFCPIFRSHGSETPREIWEMGEFTPVLMKFDNLRYRLMPYIYSQAWKITNQGYTIMRGLPMDFASDTKTFGIDNQFMFGPSIMACPVTDYMYYCPPQASVKVPASVYSTADDKPGLQAKYYKDPKYQTLGIEKVDSMIDCFWYTGRPEYVTDSMFAIHWEGTLTPQETGKHQFHMKSFDRKRIILDGDTLPIVYTSTEQYTAIINLEAGKKYHLVVETENTSTGAARFILFWKTPSIFAAEKTTVDRIKTRLVYLPANTTWFDFWTGKKYEGGQELPFDAPKEIMPLLVKAGSIIPMGPFVEYATQKKPDPIELRVYPGANGTFTLYEDENDNYNYEKGIYATIGFNWDDASKTLTIDDRKGEFPGMLTERTFEIVLVSEGIGTGVDITTKPAQKIKYNGTKMEVKL